jgi:hypothetical protein
MYYWLALFIVFPFGPLLWFIKAKDEEHRARSQSDAGEKQPTVL